MIVNIIQSVEKNLMNWPGLGSISLKLVEEFSHHQMINTKEAAFGASNANDSS